MASLQIIYNCSVFESSYCCIRFSRERKSERIKKKFKIQNSIPSFVLLNNANGRWQRMTPDLGQPLVFAAAAGNLHKYLSISDTEEGLKNGDQYHSDLECLITFGNWF